MERVGLINKVKVIIDEFAPESTGLPYEDYIGPLLDESAREILLLGPLHLISPTALPSPVTYQDDLAYIQRPDNFLRLYEVRFPKWKRSVREAISRQNDRYAVQENEYIRAGYGRPSVTIVNTTINGTTGTFLECGRVDQGAAPVTALYVREELPENIDDTFADALAWRCASKVLATVGDANRSKGALDQSLVHLQMLIK
jgi:hypothetical protein